MSRYPVLFSTPSEPRDILIGSFGSTKFWVPNAKKDRAFESQNEVGLIFHGYRDNSFFKATLFVLFFAPLGRPYDVLSMIFGLLEKY